MSEQGAACSCNDEKNANSGNHNGNKRLHRRPLLLQGGFLLELVLCPRNNRTKVERADGTAVHDLFREL